MLEQEYKIWIVTRSSLSELTPLSLPQHTLIRRRQDDQLRQHRPAAGVRGVAVVVCSIAESAPQAAARSFRNAKFNMVPLKAKAVGQDGLLSTTNFLNIVTMGNFNREYRIQLSGSSCPRILLFRSCCSITLSASSFLHRQPGCRK